MPEYINHNDHAVQLTGPRGEIIRLARKQKRELPDYYDRYRARGMIKLVNEHTSVPQSSPTPQAMRRNRLVKSIPAKTSPQSIKKVIKQTVGQVVHEDPNAILSRNLNIDSYPISNGIGVGILSYNRSDSLKRLIDSITKYTNLSQTTIFVSDDCSTDPATIAYLEELKTNNNIIVLPNTKRLGIAGNSNRLLLCLSRFRYGLLLNDDVEILRDGWEDFYPSAMRKTGYHHLIHRQPGVYNAVPGIAVNVNGVKLEKVTDKPHGAILAFNNQHLSNVGYFDESYGFYGMEHVEWSERWSVFQVQEPGFFDVSGSSSFFKVHGEASAVENRAEHLRKAKKIYAERIPQRYMPSNAASDLPSISYVIPFRNIGRDGAIAAVLNNVRAQRFPIVNIIAVEQDTESRINVNDLLPCTYCFSKSGPLFNKSLAFNDGVCRVKDDCVILHDADTMAQGSYTSNISTILRKYESCHICSRVLYTNQEACNNIVNNQIVDINSKCDRIVGYFEGGSLACRTSAYWKVGGFNIDFQGYGCEDCDFYARLSQASNWHEARRFDLLHLWHPRVPGWNEHHQSNKILEQRLKAKSIPERVASQIQQLRNGGYL